MPESETASSLGFLVLGPGWLEACVLVPGCAWRAAWAAAPVGGEWVVRGAHVPIGKASRLASRQRYSAFPMTGFLMTARASADDTCSSWKKRRCIRSTSFLAVAGSPVKADSAASGSSAKRMGTMPCRWSPSNKSAATCHSCASTVGILSLHV